jgi:hypothetical protein
MMLVNQIPAPPADMVMPAVYKSMLIPQFAVLALVLAWIIVEARKAKSLTPILILVGAAVASLCECLWDVLDCVWYPQYGQTPLYRIFNISVPVWMLTAYPCYLGGLGYWVYKWLGKGMTLSQLWTFWVIAWLANFVLEIPMLQLGVYVYYGPQPFKILGFPLWQAMGNSLMPIFIGAIVYAWKDVLHGLRSLLIVPIVPVAMVFALGGVGWPMWLAMNSGRGYEVTYPAAVVSLGLSLMLVYLVGLKVCRPAQARVTAAQGVDGSAVPGGARS